MYWKEALLTPGAGMKLNVPFAFIDSLPEAKVQSNGAVVSPQPTMPVTTSGSPSTSVSLWSTPRPDGVVRTTLGVAAAARSTRSSVLPKVEKVSLTAVGGSLTGLIVIVNVTGAEVSTPPFAVPPLSCSVTVTVALPNAFGAEVKVSTPAAEIAGCTEKRALLLFDTLK